MQHACKILNMFEILISVVWGKSYSLGGCLVLSPAGKGEDSRMVCFNVKSEMFKTPQKK